MSHHSSSVNGEGTSHKDPLSRIIDELSSLKLWKEKLGKKEKVKEMVEINQDEREQIREEERRKRYSTLLFSAEFSLAEEQGLKKKLRKLFGKGRRRRKMSGGKCFFERIVSNTRHPML